MNFNKSIKLALMDRKKTQEWLAGQMGITGGALSAILTRNSKPQGQTIDRAAKALGMKSSALIALGED